MFSAQYDCEEFCIIQLGFDEESNFPMFSYTFVEIVRFYNKIVIWCDYNWIDHVEEIEAEFHQLTIVDNLVSAQFDLFSSFGVDK